MTEPLAPRITDRQVADLRLGRARTELMEEIMASPTATSEQLNEYDRRPRTPRWAVVVAAAAAIAVIVATPVWLASRGGQGPAPADRTPSATTGASGAPRPYAVLVAPGWTVDDVDGDPADGEIEYAHGERSLQINWRPAGSYAGYVEDRADIGPATGVTLLARPAQTWAYGPRDHTTIRPAQGRTFLEVRGEGMRRPAYLRLLASLRGVDAAGFGAALPAFVVLPDEVASTVRSMLAEVTLPYGFDADGVRVPAFQDEYGVGMAVSSAVTCSWVEVYQDARRTGDSAAREQAASAMAGSRQWRWLRQMQATGDWPSGIWEIADDMGAGRPIPGWVVQDLDCR